MPPLIKPPAPSVNPDTLHDEDANQRVRTGRFLLSLSMYVWCVIPLALATWADFVPVYVAVIWMLASFGGNAAFYFMFRSGYNKRFKDPSLTLPQMWLGIIIVLFTQIFAGP